MREREGAGLVALMVTDIMSKATQLYASGDRAALERAYGDAWEDGVAALPGVMSRKKQVAPALLGALLVAAGGASARRAAERGPAREVGTRLRCSRTPTRRLGDQVALVEHPERPAAGQHEVVDRGRDLDPRTDQARAVDYALTAVHGTRRRDQPRTAGAAKRPEPEPLRGRRRRPSDQPPASCACGSSGGSRRARCSRRRRS